MDLFRRHSFARALVGFAWLTAALMIPGICHSEANGNTNREIDLSASDTLELQSFYTSKAAKPGESDPANRAWGIKMASALPLEGLHASLDYVMTAVPDNVQTLADQITATSFTAHDNHLLQLRLHSQWQDIDYGLRYFSAGENFARVNLGQDLLNAAGAMAATDGTELWANMRVADFELKPSARRLVTQQPGQHTIDHQYILNASRPMFRDTRFEYQYLASTRVTETQTHSNSRLADQTNQTRVQLSHPHWRIAWNNLTQAQQLADQPITRTTQQISGTVELLDEFTLAPSVSRSRADEGASEVQQHSSAALSLGYQPKDTDTPQLNLTLTFNQSSGLRENEKDLSADLGVKKHITLPGMTSAQTSVSASLSYRRVENTLNGLREDSMGVIFTFEHAVGG